MKISKPHPIANMFPMMTADQFSRLKEDIQKNGVKSFGLLFEGQILDGRNRYKACQELGIEMDWMEDDEPVPDFDPVAYVLTHNLHRRQLHQSQRAIVAARMATLKNGQIGNGRKVGPQNCGATSEDAAKLLNVSKRSVETAKYVLEHGSKDLIEAIETRTLSVSLAAKLCKVCDDKREQTRLVKEGKAAIKQRVTPTITETEDESEAFDYPFVTAFSQLDCRENTLKKLVGVMTDQDVKVLVALLNARMEAVEL